VLENTQGFLTVIATPSLQTEFLIKHTLKRHQIKRLIVNAKYINLAQISAFAQALGIWLNLLLLLTLRSLNPFKIDVA